MAPALAPAEVVLGVRQVFGERFADIASSHGLPAILDAIRRAIWRASTRGRPLGGGEPPERGAEVDLHGGELSAAGTVAAHGSRGQGDGTERLDAAVRWLRCPSLRLGYSDQLSLYGLYQQATSG